MLLTLTMLPWPLAAIPGANAATRKNGARTLLANSASKVRTSRSAVAPNTENPPLLTRTSMSPAASARCRRPAGSPRSAATKRASPPAAVIASTVPAPRPASLPWTMTSAPSLASRTATARPMPEVAPVTSALRPSRSRCSVAAMPTPHSQLLEQTGLSVSSTVDRPVCYCQAMSIKTMDRRSARERLLAAADELFYADGVHTVGIDRVIERAGVAKATLYSAFGSKDELIRCYLTARHAARQERMTRKLARYDTPRARLLGVFDVLGES